MFRLGDDDQWAKSVERKFSIDLNEAIRDELDRVDGEITYEDLARKVVGLLSSDDLSQLAFEGLQARVGSYVRMLRRPKPRSANGSARWDNVAENRNKLEEHYVQTGDGLKPLLDCTAYDLEGAVAYYTEKGNAYHARAKAYDEVKSYLTREGGETVADLDESLVERRLGV